LVNQLLKGATAHGFATDLWTCPRIARFIRQRYRVRYHVDHIPKLMASLGFSPSEAPEACPGT
jgi:transposase